MSQKMENGEQRYKLFERNADSRAFCDVFDAERAAHTHTHKQRALATHIFHDFTRAQASVHAVVCERLERDVLKNCTQTLTSTDLPLILIETLLIGQCPSKAPEVGGV